jgi:hypothetical protein
MNAVLPEPAIADAEWLEPEELYLSVGAECEIDRPIFQGDVFTQVLLPVIPRKPPKLDEEESLKISFARSMVMVVPHPCQCYHGDKLRPWLTVAPVKEVPSYDNFGETRTGAADKFALLDLPAGRGEGASRSSHVADFGRITSIGAEYLSTSNRVACLSHMGLGLLAKRLLRFQLRAPSELAQVMAFTQKQWNESFLMQAWVRKHGSLKGYSNWQKTALVVPALGGEIIPDEFILSSHDVLIGYI